ncbi:hypothetical protein EK904_001005, partial [Melospiza melodia maxima]
ACQGERDGFLQSSSGQRLQPATRPTLPSKAKRELRNLFTTTESDITTAHSRARDYFPALNAYLRPFGIVIELFHHIHPLFGIDRAIHCGILQSQALQVHSYNFEHARPLRDNHAGERTGSSQPALTTGTVWSLQCLTQNSSTRPLTLPPKEPRERLFLVLQQWDLRGVKGKTQPQADIRFFKNLRNLLVFISVRLLNQDLQLHHAPLMDQAVRSRNPEGRKGEAEEYSQDELPRKLPPQSNHLRQNKDYVRKQVCDY